MSDSLKPCPFCGHDDALLSHKIDACAFVECTACNAQGEPFGFHLGGDTDAEAGALAIKAWNRRAND